MTAVKKSSTTKPDFNQLNEMVIGIPPETVEYISQAHTLYTTGLSPVDRPIGASLSCGPTGVGKTRTVECVAELIHGSTKNLLRIDCGEFQLEHDVAKLVGAPPGYLGHRETPPILTQQRLSAITSERSNMSIILFDEIEKSAPSMVRLLLGMLDRAMLKTGDNVNVNFERTLFFFTSNIGSSYFNKTGMGFDSSSGYSSAIRNVNAMLKKKFPPEFLGRIDEIFIYHPLTSEEIDDIIYMEIQKLESHVILRLGINAPDEIKITTRLKNQIASVTNLDAGARDVGRKINRLIGLKISKMLAENKAVFERKKIVCDWIKDEVKINVN